MNTAFEIAEWFLCAVDRESGDVITHLKLQKLLYYAQAWSLVLLKKPMFNEEIQAWAHGPVVPEVYRIYSTYKMDNIPAPEDCPEGIEEDYKEVLQEVMQTYGIYEAKYLEKLTHQEEPWKEARNGISLEARCTTPISLKTMQEYYTKMQEGRL